MRQPKRTFEHLGRLRTRAARALAFGAALAGSILAPDGARAADIGALDANVQEIIEMGKQGCAADLETYCASVTPGEGRLAFCLIANADKRSASCEAALDRARTAAEQLINDATRSEDACAADISRVCAGTQSGGGRIAQCLADNRPYLDDKCAEVIDAVGKVIFAPANQAAATEAEAEADFVTSAANIVAAPPVPPAADAPPTANAPPAAADTPPAPSATPFIDALAPKVQAILEKGKIGCQADLDTYCSTISPGEGRLAFCLIAHADKRSFACERAVDEARGEVETLINDVSLAIEACLPDIRSHCGGTQPGEGRIAQCLADNRPSLSETCGEVIDVVGKAIFPAANKTAAAAPTPTLPPAADATPPASTTPIADALAPRVQAILEKGKIGCQADLDTYCSTVTPGEGRLAFCLTAHADKRSFACERAVDEARGEVETLINDVSLAIEACLPDIRSHCGGTQPGEGRIAQCLADNRPSLSETCGEVIDVVGKAIFPSANQGAALPAFAGPNSTAAIPDPKIPDPKAEAAPPTCKWLEASVSDWGKDATRRDARKHLNSRVSAFAAGKGLTDYKPDVSVTCATNVDLGVAANYTCRARAEVCWDEAAGSAAAGTSAPANKP